MAAAAGLAVTLIPVLMGYLIRGRIPAENSNPLNRFLIAAYRPALNAVLRAPKLTLVVAAALLFAVSLLPLRNIGASSCHASTRAICCTCRPRFPALDWQGDRIAATDRPADQNPA